MQVVVNLGGEGEVPGAINVNAFIEASMINRGFAGGLPEALVVRRSAHDTGLGTASVDVVVANQFPIHFDEFIVDESGAQAPIALLCQEVVRILIPGGSLRFHCSSCDRDSLRTAFVDAGLGQVSILSDGTIEGVR